MPRAVLAAALAHLGQATVERGGLLLGRLYHDDGDPARIVAARVEGVVPGSDSEATGFSLRMEAGVWTAAREAIGRGQVVLGWYHSHPDLGAFFSETDRRTQRAFFPHPWSLGWVIDPIRREQAWFVGPRAEAVPPDRVWTHCDSAGEGMAALEGASR